MGYVSFGEKACEMLRCAITVSYGHWVMIMGDSQEVDRLECNGKG